MFSGLISLREGLTRQNRVAETRGRTRKTDRCQIVKLTYFSEELSRHVILQVAHAIRYLHEEKGVKVTSAAGLLELGSANGTYSRVR
jgi:hypothetical protein